MKYRQFTHAFISQRNQHMKFLYNNAVYDGYPQDARPQGIRQYFDFEISSLRSGDLAAHSTDGNAGPPKYNILILFNYLGI